MNDYTELKFLAQTFESAQDARMALENKIRSSADPLFFNPAIAHYKAVEHEMGLAIRKTMRKTVAPGIIEWQRAERGIGEHLLARLLGSIGDPRVAIPHHWEGKGKENRVLVAEAPRPRTIGQLWAYCGHGNPKRCLHKDMTAEDLAAVGNRSIKSVVWNLSKGAMIQGVRKTDDGGRVAISHYGTVYLARRTATMDRLHQADCPQCLSLVGTPWKDGHSHADALRIVGKEILRDLWISAGANVIPRPMPVAPELVST